VEALGVGQEHQETGPRQVGHEGGEPVVVAETDLVGGDGVVLIDDRQRPQRQQPVQSVTGVEVVRAMHEVVARQEHLGGDEAVLGQPARVEREQAALSHGGRGLQARHV
jgi:hypothetical protein